MTNSDKPTAGCGGGEATSKFYMLKLTKEELWILSENYAAAFTDPEARNAIECQVSDKLTELSSKAHKAALASNPLEGKGIQSKTEQASSGLRSPTSGEG